MLIVVADILVYSHNTGEGFVVTLIDMRIRWHNVRVLWIVSVPHYRHLYWPT